MQNAARSLDFILSTVNISLDWHLYLESLLPKGKLHIVGAVPEPISVQVFQLIGMQRSITASPVGSPLVTKQMLDFCMRHNIYPITEEFPMSKVNEAIEHLHSGKARYRVVLKNDF